MHSRRISRDRSTSEAEFWDGFDIQLARKTGWTSAGDLGYWAFQKMCDGRYTDIVDLILEMMEIPRTQPLRGLVLGCGDMAGEHVMFMNPQLPIAEVDAYDVSSQSIARGRRLTDEKGLTVNYVVTDVNQVHLPPNRYALVVVFHAYHHFQAVEHVAQQINRALMPGGVFYTWDYIGRPKLQFTPRQLYFAQMMLELLPTKYRHELDGRVRERVESVPEMSLSPDEAVCSDRIPAAIGRHLAVKWQYNWAGLLHPLLEGIAFNFTDAQEDQSLLRFLFDLDFALCQTGEVEPNFTVTLATKR